MRILNASEQPGTVSHPAQGFANRYGIHPLIAFFTLCTDLMLFSGEAATFGVSLPLSLIVSSAVGYATYKGQQAWYGDSADSAKTKRYQERNIKIALFKSSVLEKGRGFLFEVCCRSLLFAPQFFYQHYLTNRGYRYSPSQRLKYLLL